MRVLIFGADGFIGSNVCEVMSEDEVFCSSRRFIKYHNKNCEAVLTDLSDSNNVYEVINEIKPEVVINCAGIIGPANHELNVDFTKNIIEQSNRIKSVKKIIISGSAGAYGVLRARDLPVKETTQLNAQSGYGLSKLKEEALALRYGDEYNINVVVLRIFNPIGLNMNEKLLLSDLIRQIGQIKLGQKASIELSRLDSVRDYISVKDVALAFKAVAKNHNKWHIYNVGSGISTKNEELLNILLDNCNISDKLHIIETSDQKEPVMASCADISRIKEDLDWHPLYSIKDTIEEIVRES